MSLSPDEVRRIAALAALAVPQEELPALTTQLENIAALLIERRYPKNSIIVEEGLPGDYMYVIRSGRVKVTKASDDGREKIMDFFEAGAFFGEMALLDSAPRSASVRTLEPSVLAMMHGPVFAGDGRDALERLADGYAALLAAGL